MQFNFWRDSVFDLQSNSIVQMSTSSASNIGTNLVSVLNLLNWAKVGVIQCSDCYDSSASVPFAFKTIKRVLEDRGIEVLVTIECSQANITNTDEFAKILKGLEKRARILLPFFGNTLGSYVDFLRAFKKAGLSKNDYNIIITLAQYTINAAPDKPWVINNQNNAEILGLFDGAIVVGYFPKLTFAICFFSS